jgi:hypothetical protein
MQTSNSACQSSKLACKHGGPHARHADFHAILRFAAQASLPFWETRQPVPSHRILAFLEVLRSARGGAEMAEPHVFFWSYARADAQDGPELDRFYTDLCREVRGRLGRAEADRCGFRDDRGIELAAPEWASVIGGALASARAFVALYSPTYFTREACGKEWTIFRERLLAYTGERGQSLPPLIFPVLWLPLKARFTRLPQHVRDIQYAHTELGALYAEKGCAPCCARTRRTTGGFSRPSGRSWSRRSRTTTCRPLPASSGWMASRTPSPTSSGMRRRRSRLAGSSGRGSGGAELDLGPAGPVHPGPGRFWYGQDLSSL